MECKHFSHQHNLIIHQVQEGQQITCSGCNLPCYHTIHACWQCNFFLHDHCANANRYVKHPSHEAHPLILLPNPTYCAATFICNACGQSGNSFTYCCAPCEVDLHVHCAFLPPTVTHKCHHHELGLTFSSGTAIKPKGTAPEFCKICTKVLDPRHWSYSCDKCEFGVHTFCATTEVTPSLYQDDPDETPQTAAGPAAEEEEEEEVEVEVPQEFLNELYRLRLKMQLAQLVQSMETMGNIR